MQWLHICRLFKFTTSRKETNNKTDILDSVFCCKKGCTIFVCYSHSRNTLLERKEGTNITLKACRKDATSDLSSKKTGVTKSLFEDCTTQVSGKCEPDRA